MQDLLSACRGGGGVDVSAPVEDDAVDAFRDRRVESAPLDVGPDILRIAAERIAEASAGRAPELEDVVGSELDPGCVGIDRFCGASAAVHDEFGTGTGRTSTAAGQRHPPSHPEHGAGELVGAVRLEAHHVAASGTMVPGAVLTGPGALLTHEDRIPGFEDLDVGERVAGLSSDDAARQREAIALASPRRCPPSCRPA